MDRRHSFEGLKDIMFGFGDEEVQNPETKELMEQMLTDFYDKTIREAHKRSHAKGVGNSLLIPLSLYINYYSS